MFRIDRDRGWQWYAKWREPCGRQVKRRIGPAWTGRGRPDPGFFTRRTAEEWLRATLTEAEDRVARGVDSEVTFGTAAAEWLRYVEHDCAVKPSTLRDYPSGLRHHLLPAFGERRLADITPAQLERWRSAISASPRTKNKLIVCVGSVYRRAARVYGCTVNPAAGVERLRERRQLDVDVFTPEEVWALVRAAESEEDAATFLTAAFTGLRRGELLALRWRDVDFAGASVRVRASYHAYGYRRTWKALLRAGEIVGRDRVKRLMRQAGIQGAKRRGKPWRTTVPEPAAKRLPDLVQRDFTAAAPDRRWVADFTYLRCWEGLVFCSFVIDAFSRRVVGWQFAARMRTDLVLDALRMALTRRQAGADVELVHHSDAGSVHRSQSVDSSHNQPCCEDRLTPVNTRATTSGRCSTITPCSRRSAPSATPTTRR